VNLRHALLLSTAAFVAIACLAQGAAAAKIDVVADTYHVVDGDTLDAFPVGRIRLADIDTPESGQPGYSEAKEAVRGYTEGKRVYLDVDLVDVDDPNNRLVAVVFVRHNATHLLNVNRALVDADLAVVDDYANEFDPATWPLYLRADGAELPTLWDPAHAAYVGALRNLSSAQSSLSAATSDLTEAEAARDAALAELERVSAFLNGSVPASEEALQELNATRADLEQAQARAAASGQALEQAQADLSAANQELDQAHHDLASANDSTSTAWAAAGVVAAAVGAAAFAAGRRAGAR
jgi:endonuclease YncB( thermonuclease family)